MTGNNYLNDGREEEESAGRAAAKAGLPFAACPHPTGSYASYDWMIGWYEGDQLKQDQMMTDKTETRAMPSTGAMPPLEPVYQPFRADKKCVQAAMDALSSCGFPVDFAVAQTAIDAYLEAAKKLGWKLS